MANALSRGLILEKELRWLIFRKIPTADLGLPLPWSH
jgi:hypothetical protein